MAYIVEQLIIAAAREAATRHNGRTKLGRAARIAGQLNTHDTRNRKRRTLDAEWQRERAMQAGMGLGIEAYNDEMGYGE